MLAAAYHGQRDIRLAEEAEEVIKAHMKKRNPGGDKAGISLKVHLELETILGDEYR